MNFRYIKEKEIFLLEKAPDMKDFNDKLDTSKIWKVRDFGMMGIPQPGFTEIKEKDGLINFTTGTVAAILSKMKNFFSEKTCQKYLDLKMAHKVGLLLHGPQGTGKTSIALLVMKSLIEKYNTLCLDFTGYSVAFMLHTLKSIREVQDGPIVVFYDEVEVIARNKQLLTFLDGNESFDKLVFISCTNHLNDIPLNIRERRSRIKYSYLVNSLPIEVYKEYLINKLPNLSKEVIAEFSYKAEEKNLSIDGYKNAIMDYYIDGISIDEAVSHQEGITKEEILNESEEEEEDDA